MICKRYILVTPAHNEETFIDIVAQTVLTQTILPIQWIIVDDASTDMTSRIIKSYSEKYDFITYHRIERSSLVTYYNRRTCVFLEGFHQIKDENYDYVGALDADITLQADYYENILACFEDNPKLGIATGIYLEKINGDIAPLIPRYHESTPGGLQLFRKQCYIDIGGYRPLNYGGDDTLAGVMARMKGWETLSFPQYQAIHHRPIGQRGAGALRAKFRQGLTDCQLGSHGLFMIAKWIRRIFLERPFFLSSTARLAGYIWGHISLRQNEVPQDAAQFYRREQLKRIFSFARRGKIDTAGK